MRTEGGVLRALLGVLILALGWLLASSSPVRGEERPKMYAIWYVGGNQSSANGKSTLAEQAAEPYRKDGADSDPTDSKWFGWELGAKVYGVTVMPTLKNGVVRVMQYAPAGAQVQVQALPDYGYSFEGFICESNAGQPVAIATDGGMVTKLVTGTFTMPAEEVRVSATFTSNELLVAVNGSDQQPAKSLKEALKGVDLTTITELTIKAGQLTQEDWNWIPDEKDSYGMPLLRGLEKLTVLEGVQVEDIPASVFQEFNNLKEVSIPNVKRIGKNAFFRCMTLSKAQFPDVEVIEAGAFETCLSLEEISFPSLREVGEQSFQSCWRLTAIDALTRPRLERIGSGAFAGTGLVSADLSFVKSVGLNAFLYSRSLRRVILPSDPPEVFYSTYNYSYTFNGIELGDASLPIDEEKCYFYVSTAAVKARYEQTASWTASYCNYAKSIRVMDAPTSFKVKPEEVELFVKEEKQLQVYDFLPNDNPLICTAVRWSSDNESVATVDATGLVKALGAGRAKITAKSEANEGITASCLVIVSLPHPTELKFGAKRESMTVGDQFTFTVESIPEGSDARVQWTSSDPKVLEIDATTGAATALGAGRARITAKSLADSKINLSLTVKVEEKSASQGGSVDPNQTTPVASDAHPFHLVPNPTSALFRVSGVVEPTTVRVLSLQGAVLVEFRRVTEGSELDVHFLPTGLYLVESHGRTQRLMIRR